MSARRAGASQSRVSVRMLRVVTVRPSRTATLIGPPPMGMAPTIAYSLVSRPAARMTRNSGDAASPRTTIADSAPMTSSALPTIVSSTSLRSSEDVSDWPMAPIACSRSACRCWSLTSVTNTAAPARPPSPSRHGAQRALSHTIRSSASVVRGSSTVSDASPARARRISGTSVVSRNSGNLAAPLRPTASALPIPVRRSMAAFHSTTSRAGSRTTSASLRLSRKPLTTSCFGTRAIFRV